MLSVALIDITSFYKHHALRRGADSEITILILTALYPDGHINSSVVVLELGGCGPPFDLVGRYLAHYK